MSPTEDAPRRSWSELSTDLAGEIFGRILCHADRVRFGAVCRQWRISARRNPLPRQFPWLALPNRTFYSLPNSAFRRLPLHLHRHRQLPHAQSSCGEWLVFQHHDGAYTLVSPFSTATTMVLPRMPTDPPVTHDTPPPLQKLVVCSPTLVAAVVGTRPSQLLLCRPGSASWSCRHDRLQALEIQDMVSYQGKLHALVNSGDLLSISISEDDDSHAGGEPTVSSVDCLVRISPGRRTEPPLYLVESEGALLMVRKENHSTREGSYSDDDESYSSSDEQSNVILNPDDDDSYVPLYSAEQIELQTKFEVFAADMAGSRWRKVRSVGGDRVLFVGHWCSRSVHVVPDVHQGKAHNIGDRIFFLQDRGADGYGGQQWRTVEFFCTIYDMRERRSQLFLKTPLRPVGSLGTWLFPPSGRAAGMSEHC
ncbi:hypothetical protein OsI_08609 [Oryza sativa Indica Group]|jgi:hypothetical protein|uniref:KIB1-4 beta-propeller domain-containing protein n=2 Tax=Oryza TaxID=4527 RepID=A0A0E0GBT9_ORYNI|nr:hypothetical protein OsI_08609 [Oryza sativa Indica Group]